MVRIKSKRLNGVKKSPTVKSMMIYNYLKSKDREEGGSQDGLSMREISKGVIQAYNLNGRIIGKKQVAAAIRRGINYGIVEKVGREKYRFDGNSSVVSSWREACDRARKKPAKTRPPKKQPVPRPRVPRPPSFKPRQKNLREEPMPRVRKHGASDIPYDRNDPGFPLI